MGASGCCGKLFVALNFIMWLIGFGVVGYGVWIMITTGNTNNFLSGTLIFTYAFLGIGALLVFTGLLGCIGGCCESICCLKAYIGFMTFILLIDIGVAIAGYVEKDNVFDLTEKLWDEVNDDTKFHIQKELECCSYNGTEEYTTLPDSCYNDQGEQFQTFCKDAMEQWVKDNVMIWGAIVGGIGFIQVIAIISSCLALRALEESMRVGALD